MLKPSRFPNPAALRDINESALASIAKQAVLTDTGNQDVGVTVVVVIANGHAHAVQFDVESGSRGDIRERSVAVVVIKTKCSARFLVSGPVGAVDQQDVLPSIAS